MSSVSIRTSSSADVPSGPLPTETEVENWVPTSRTGGMVWGCTNLVSYSFITSLLRTAVSFACWRKLWIRKYVWAVNRACKRSVLNTVQLGLGSRLARGRKIQ